VVANDTDVNGNLDPSTVSIVTQPTAGTATPNADGTVTYTNTDPAALSDSFTYTVADTTNLVSNAATVTITTATNPPSGPIAPPAVFEPSKTTMPVAPALTSPASLAFTGLASTWLLTGVGLVLVALGSVLWLSARSSRKRGSAV
jgi:hypothetical protein